ncbi:MAG: hypothetical protein WC061_06395 [Melioribacteraceae bacterium]
MKKIISLLVLISSIVSAQIPQTKSLAELKQLAASSGNHPSSISHLVSGIKYPESSIQYPAFSKKSPALAILYSMLLPGMGELYAESYSSGKYFTIADGILWGTFAGFTIYGKQQEGNYKSFAQSNAGAVVNGKDSEYFANLGIYQSLDEYNQAMELNRRFDKTYNPATHYWNWTNPDQRKEYREIWTTSESAYTNVRFVVGALIINRVISVINAIRLVSNHNKNFSEELSWNIYMDVEDNTAIPNRLSLNFVTRL